MKRSNDMILKYS